MSNEITTIPKRELPVLADLYDLSNVDSLFKTDQFNHLMNQEPKGEWIAINKYANNSKYIPIGIKETLLQRIFKRTRIEILREGTMFNAVYVTIRLHYLHPITGEWDFHDGTGADQIQTKSGASPADLGSIGNNAVAMSLPKAVSFAISDATDHIGKLFGRDLNREKQMAFGVDNNLDKEADLNELKALFAVVQDFIPADKFDNIKSVIDNKQVKQYYLTKTFLEKIKITE
jgi:hypothetical protein